MDMPVQEMRLNWLGSPFPLTGLYSSMWAGLKAEYLFEHMHWPRPQQAVHFTAIKYFKMCATNIRSLLNKDLFHLVSVFVIMVLLPFSVNSQSCTSKKLITRRSSPWKKSSWRTNRQPLTFWPGSVPSIIWYSEVVTSLQSRWTLNIRYIISQARVVVFV